MPKFKVRFRAEMVDTFEVIVEAESKEALTQDTIKEVVGFEWPEESASINEYEADVEMVLGEGVDSIHIEEIVPWPT